MRELKIKILQKLLLSTKSFPSYYLEGQEVLVAVNKSGVPLSKEWREIFEDNKISPCFEIIKSKSIKKDGQQKSKS